MAERPNPAPVLRAEKIGKQFGAVQALADADLTVEAGEILGIVGHNGAGKSTLVNILAGNLPSDTGTMAVAGQTVDPHHLVGRAGAFGIRMVFQELSLCENLTIAENFLLRHRALAGPRWRRDARRLATASLRDIFPSQALDPDRRVGSLPIGQRQMVEIAAAAASVDTEPLRLLILDEPTSSLDARNADELAAWLQRAKRTGLSIIVITHRLRELVGAADRIVVMRDGRVVGVELGRTVAAADLVTRMGQIGAPGHAEASGRTSSVPGRAVVAIERFSQGRLRDIDAAFGRGEIVGLGGLADHGQRDLLLAVFRAARARGRTVGGASGRVRVSEKVAYVSGDRGREGIFAQWSTGLNIAIGSLVRIAPRLWLHAGLETRLGQEWLRELEIRAPSVETPITALSGGSQQKAIMARALGSGAQTILFDDPTRGVDVMTKREFYARMRREADAGRTFVLYSTENEELLRCDRVLVLLSGRVVGELSGDDLTENALVRASFADAA